MDETVGERIARLRSERKLSRTQLAAAAGMTAPAIQQVEEGTSKQPSFTNGVRIAAALGVSPAYLALGAEPFMLQGGEDATGLRSAAGSTAESWGLLRAELRTVLEKVVSVERTARFAQETAEKALRQAQRRSRKSG